jgi:hypothetical protein
VSALPLGMALPYTESGFLPRLYVSPLEWGKTTMTRIKLSLKLGILAGIIWGLLFTSYYSMLPNFEFAWKSASLCFALMVIIILALPYLYNAFKKAYYEGKNK